MAKKNITTQGTPIQGLLTQTLSNVFDVNNLASIKSKPSDDSLDRFNTLDYALVTKYVQNGLTVTSNDVNIHPRDTAGNIIMQENSAENPLLIIEPTTTKISTTSMLRVLDTRFEYYKFPVTRVDIAELPEIDLSDLVSDPPDPFYARYGLSTDFELKEKNTIASGILLDNVIDGLPQATANAYTVNQVVKDSGKNLRLRARIKYSFVNNNKNYGYVFFHVSRGGTSGLDREFAGPFQALAVKGAKDDDNIGLIKDDETLTLDIEFIIENKDFQTGTTFGITIKNTEPGTIVRRDETFLSITDASKNVDDFNRPV